MTPALSVADLTKVYEGRPAVDALSFEVPWNRVTGFLGPNGAGKSTTLRMLLGLAKPTAGSALVMGRPYVEIDEPGEVVGVLLETQQFHPLRGARDHLRVYAAAMGIGDHRVDEVLEMMDLQHAAGKQVGRFSLGMRQRLGLASALLGDPRILVLDEPANGLDPSGMKWLRSFLRSFATDERAVFVSSHLLAEVSQMADEVVVINRGRFVVHSAVSELVARAERRVEVRTDQPERLRDLLVRSGASVELVSHEGLVAEGIGPRDVGRVAAAAGIALFGLEASEGSLEDVFLELTGGEEIR